MSFPRETTLIHGPGGWQAWWRASRPRSWPVAPAPVIVGAAVAWQARGTIDLRLAALALLAAWLMQVITNLQNDVGYTARIGAAQGRHHVGLPRATAQGWLSEAAVRRAVLGLSLLATALGVAMVVWRGWPVLAIGSVSLLGALAYMGGPRPVAYTPFGELSVFVHFGLIAVLGTEWLLTDAVSATGWVAGACVGAWAAAALCVNNHRDIAHDRQQGRRTFAVRFGAAAARRLFIVLIGAAPALLCLGMALATASPAWCLPLLGLPAGLGLSRTLGQCNTGAAHNALLARTFRLGLVQALLLALAVVLQGAGPAAG